MGIIILFWIIGTVIVSLWASVWERSKILFGVLSIILTPIVAGLILLTRGHRKGFGNCLKCGKWREISCIHCDHVGIRTCPPNLKLESISQVDNQSGK